MATSFNVRLFSKKKETHNVHAKQKEAEKEKIYEEFGDRDIEDVVAEYREMIEATHEELEESFSSLQSGRANPNIFDNVMV